MKKIMLFIMLMMFGFTINVNAANKVVKPEDNEFNSYKTQYEKGIQKSTINGSGIITLYGYSSCQTGSCTYKYANTNQDFKEVLKQAVVCSGGEKYTEIFYGTFISGGEKYIIYQTTGGADGYKSSNSANYSGEVYWSEDFSITCTNTSTSSTVTLNNSTAQPTTQASNGSGDYGSSGGTTTNEDQGVETYYIILGIVGIITYLLTIVVKKQNLFKKV